MVGRRGEKVKPSQLKPPSGSRSPRPEATNELSQLLAESLCPLLDQMTNINQQLTTLNQNFAAQQLKLNETKKLTDQAADTLKEVNAKSKKVKKHVQELEKKRITDESQLLQLQMEKASFILRFQGVPGTKGENLKQVLGDLLAPMADLKMEYLQSKMDVVYRSYSEYIKKNNLPGEIVVRFSKRHVREQILKTASGIPMKINGNTIRILKDIPFEIRKKRKKFKDLALFLQTNNIQYKWLVPEGLLFRINEKKERNDSVKKANEFLKQQLGRSGEDDKDEDQDKESGENSSTTEEDSDSELGAVAPKRDYDLRKRNAKK